MWKRTSLKSRANFWRTKRLFPELWRLWKIPQSSSEEFWNWHRFGASHCRFARLQACAILAPANNGGSSNHEDAQTSRSINDHRKIYGCPPTSAKCSALVSALRFASANVDARWNGYSFGCIHAFRFSCHRKKWISFYRNDRGQIVYLSKFHPTNFRFQSCIKVR